MAMDVLIVWTATCWVDLLETFPFMSLWWSLDRPIHDDMTVVEDDDDNVVLTAADRRTKGIVIGTILVPKVAIATCLWWLGARWLVATTSFQELLLNAVALAFITELDELIYTAMVPEDIQVLIQSYKIAKASQNQTVHEVLDTQGDDRVPTMTRHRNRTFLLRMMGMLLTLCVIVGLPIVYIRFLQ